MNKVLLRRRLRAARRDLEPAQRARESAAVVAHLRPLLSGTVMAFVPVKHEIDVRPALVGLDVLYPRVQDGRIVAARPDDGWAVSRFGVPEPVGPPVDGIDHIVLPGLGFTPDGARLGYGGSFYDRFLAGRTAQRIAVAFSVQVVASLPMEPHDQWFDVLVTADGVQAVAGRAD